MGYNLNPGFSPLILSPLSSNTVANQASNILCLNNQLIADTISNRKVATGRSPQIQPYHFPYIQTR